MVFLTHQCGRWSFNIQSVLKELISIGGILFWVA